MNELHLLQERIREESPVMQAGEGYSAEARMLVRISEIRTLIKTLQEEEKDLSDQLKDHIKITGEIVQTDTQRASIEPAVSVSYDTDQLAFALGDRYELCLGEPAFDKAKLEAYPVRNTTGL